MAKFDILIKNGHVIDGTGRPRFKADVGVKDGKIASVGELSGSADKVIDAAGLFVSPGFVDCHSHSDFTILIHPTGDSKILQGCTTELNGLCGFSAAPIEKERWWRLQYVRMIVGWSMQYTAAAYNAEPLPYGRQVEVDWSTLKEYLDRIEENRVGINYAMLTGHGNLRYYVVGLDAVKATKDQLDEMKAMLEQALQEGSFGLSTGLSGAPGCFANTNELVELCKVVKKHGGVYMPHQRGSIEGALSPRGMESIEIAERSGVRTCLSHVILDPEIAKLLDGARARGVDITLDQISCPGSIAGNLVFMLPHWLTRQREDGLEWIADKLRDPAVRKRLLEHDIAEWFRTTASIPDGYQAPLGPSPPKIRWDRMQLQKVWTRKNRKYVGWTFDRIAEDRGVDPWEALFDITCDEKGYVRWVWLLSSDRESMYWPAFEQNLKAPYGCVETDAPIQSPYGVTATSCDPRAYSTFPLVFGEYVRKRSVVTWEEAVKKMTLNPAQAVGITDRGVLKAGFWADVTVFNPETVAHKANFKNCLEISHPGINHDLYPVGIEYVMVNGVMAAERGKLTGSMSGRVLRHRAPSP